jgi:hypothetical protein
VSKAPLWMKNLVEKPLVDARIVPRVKLKHGDLSNNNNLYHIYKGLYKFYRIQRIS